MHVQGNIDLAGLIDNTDNGPVIKLTAYGKQGRCMTIKEISNMSFEELAAVHTVTPFCHCFCHTVINTGTFAHRACRTCQHQLLPRTSLHLQLLRHSLIVQQKHPFDHVSQTAGVEVAAVWSCI
jgi:hypothetical protein